MTIFIYIRCPLHVLYFSSKSSLLILLNKPLTIIIISKFQRRHWPTLIFLTIYFNVSHA